MKIVFGVDTSAHMDDTLSILCRMPWPRGTSVVVLSVVAPSEPQFAPTPAVLAAVAGNLAVIESREIEQHEELVTRTEEALRRAGLEAVGRIESGNPGHVLVDAAKAERADLLVIGSHDHSGFRRFAMGSISSYVIAHAPCSVLVVRRDIPELGN